MSLLQKNYYEEEPAASVTGKAKARPESENTKTDKDRLGFLQRKLTLESYFAGRKSVL